MKSGKQRRGEIKAARVKRIEKQKSMAKRPHQHLRPVLGPPVDEELLAPTNNYGAPDFVMRGYYVDKPFQCGDCGKEEIWTGSQQKWWFEVAKAFAYSGAIRCRACRRKERARRDEARRVHLAGIARKAQARTIKRTEQ